MQDPRRCSEAFAAAFGAEPQRLARAPGRVNLLGGHVDYNEGLVLPVAVDLGVVAAARPRGSPDRDRRLRVVSAQLGGPVELSLDGEFSPRGDWTDYVAGVARELDREARSKRGTLAGADLLVDGDVPIGAGLSSSAALEIAVALALGAAPDDPLALARLAQRAEQRYAGTRCGIMDQLACLQGRAGHALLIDCRSLDFWALPLPGDLSIVVCDSGVRRELARSAYNERRRQCEEATRALSALLGRRLRALRDVSEDELAETAPEMPATLRRRARHVVSEIARVRRAADALRSGHGAALGELMLASHASLRDDYEVSSPELDALLDAAREAPGFVGGRLTGAGFGGCTVNLVEAARVDDFAAALARAHGKRRGDGGALAIHRLVAADGARSTPATSSGDSAPAP